MLEQLIAAVLAFWAHINPAYASMPAAKDIARATAGEMLAEAEGRQAPVYEDANVDLAMEAYWGVRESSLDPKVPGDCPDKANPESCKAHGVWQLHGPCGTATIPQQAHCWMNLLRYSPCEEHPAATMWGHCVGPMGRATVEKLAAAREARVRELMKGVEFPAVSHAMAPARRRSVRITPEIVQAANAYLAEDKPMGTEKLVVVGGKEIGLAVEWHYHAPEEATKAPHGWHRGVSAYEVVSAPR
jgi:hypothetical protein